MRESLRSASDAAGMSKAFKAVDKAAKRGTIHRNKAARLKSRLARRVKAA